MDDDSDGIALGASVGPFTGAPSPAFGWGPFCDECNVMLMLKICAEVPRPPLAMVTDSIERDVLIPLTTMCSSSYG